MTNFISMLGDRAMNRSKWGAALSAAVVAAVLPWSQASAATPFVGAFDKGSVIGTVNAGDTGSGTLTGIAVWMDNQASGELQLEITLPEYAQFSGVAPQVWSKISGNSRNENRQPVLNGSEGTVPLASESDYICGVYGVDVDPTTGELYALLGRSGSLPQNCYRASNRWLAKYDSAAGVFRWIGYLDRFRGLEFTPDGKLYSIAGNGGANGRGAVHELNKSTGGATYRVRPTGNSSDIVYNEGDGYFYYPDQCTLYRIKPSDWSITSDSNDTGCDLWRTSAAMLKDNTLHVRGSGAFYRIVVDPSDGTVVSSTNVGAVSNQNRDPMIISDTDFSTVAKACSVSGDGKSVRCTFGSVNARAAVVAAGAVQYNIPANALPGVREGKIRLFRGGQVVAEQTLEMTVLAADVAVENMAPTSGRYFVNDTFAISVDVKAVGGKAVSGVSADFTVPDQLSVVSITGAGTCGLSRDGARCTGFSLAAGGTQTVTVNVRAEADGVAAVKATASVAAGDVDASNNTANASFVVGNAADMIATGTKGGSGAVGKAMDLSLEVTNDGPDNAANAALLIPKDAGFDLGTATTDTGTCTAGADGIRCAFGTLNVSAVAKVSLKVTPNRTGNLTLTSVASSDYVDVAGGNSGHAFAVSVPTSPFKVALGAATPGATSGDLRPILQVAISPASGSKDALRVTGVAGTVTIAAKGLSLKERVFVYEDRDGNGMKDDADLYLGSASLSADGGAFSLEFEGSITVEPGKTSNFLLAVQPAGAPTVALAPFGMGSNWPALLFAGLLPFAVAGFAFGRRRAAATLAGLLLVGLIGACSEDVEELFATATVSGTVTEVTATLLEDLDSPVKAEGLPVSGPSITLSR